MDRDNYKIPVISLLNKYLLNTYYASVIRITHAILQPFLNSIIGDKLIFLSRVKYMIILKYSIMFDHNPSDGILHFLQLLAIKNDEATRNLVTFFDDVLPEDSHWECKPPYIYTILHNSSWHHIYSIKRRVSGKLTSELVSLCHG